MAGTATIDFTTKHQTVDGFGLTSSTASLDFNSVQVAWLSVEDKSVSATTAVHGTMTLSGSDAWAALVCTYKLTASSYALVQSSNVCGRGGDGPLSSAIWLPNAVTSGNMLWLAVVFYEPAATLGAVTVVDSLGQTWQQDATQDTPSSGGSVYVFSCPATKGSAGPVLVEITSASANANGFTTAVVREYSGPTAAPFDKKASTSGTSTAPDSGATATLSQAQELILCAVGLNGGQTTFTPGSGFGNLVQGPTDGLAMTRAQADLFFSASSGIGLNIIRTGIRPDATAATAAGGDVLAAQQRVPGLKIMSTPWTPPGAYKTGGSGTNGENGGSLAVGHYADFANWLQAYVTLMAGRGMTLYALSPQNEPDFDTSGLGYGGCNYTSAQLDAFLQTAVGILSGPRLAIPEQTQWAFDRAAASWADGAVTPSLGMTCAHNYGAAAIAATGGPAGLPVWATENANTTATYDATITAAIASAKDWCDLFTVAAANAILYWQPWQAGNSNNYGLIDSDGVTTTKRVWAFGNFSKFVRPGWIRLDVSSVSGLGGNRVLAFWDPGSNRYAVVAINDTGGAISTTFTLSGAPFTGASVQPWQTDAGNDLVPQTAVAVSAGAFTFSMPANSVVTFTGGGAPPPAMPAPSTPPVVGFPGAKLPAPIVLVSVRGPLSFSVTTTEAPTTVESATRAVLFVRTAGETVTTAEAATRTESEVRTATEAPASVEALARVFSGTRAIIAAPTTAEAATQNATRTRTATEAPTTGRQLTLLLRDRFIDADNTPLTAHAMDTGPGWTAYGGQVAQIIGNKALITTGAGTQQGVVSNAGQANVLQVVSFRNTKTSNWPALTGRINTADGSGWYITNEGTSGGNMAVELYESDGASFTSRVGPVTFSPAATGGMYLFSVLYQGNTITLYNGLTQIFSYASASRNNTQTRFGIYGWDQANNSTAWWEEFDVYAAPVTYYAPAPAVQGEYFALPYWTGGSTTLHLALGTDTSNWATVPLSYTPASGIFRDGMPWWVNDALYFCHGEQATTSDTTSFFSIARSADLATAQTVKRVSAAGVGANVNQVYAPAWYFDTSLHILFAASTVVPYDDTGFGIYETHPTVTNNIEGDWSSAAALSGLPVNAIDPFMVVGTGAYAGTYFLWLKNETTKYIEVYSSTDGVNFTALHTGDWMGLGANIEAPAVGINRAGQSFVIFDAYGAGTGLHVSTQTAGDWRSGGSTTWSAAAALNMPDATPRAGKLLALSGVVLPSETAAATKVKLASTTEAPTTTETVTRVDAAVRTTAEAPTTSESATTSKTKFGAATEAPTTVEAATQNATRTRTAAEAITTVDAAAGVTLHVRTTAEAPTTVDAAVRSGVFFRADTEAVTTAEAAAQLATLLRTATEAPTTTDSANPIKGKIGTATEAITTVETATQSRTVVRTTAEAPATAEALTRHVVLARATAEHPATFESVVAVVVGPTTIHAIVIVSITVQPAITVAGLDAQPAIMVAGVSSVPD